ncbi:hypothetical protein SLEP1_g54936 [Rubroshorea leprosula]|uniref:Cobalamin-independent methionine synthase MetE C-terminal/archaeal domain-containing protein n=1 Tax=Rubroshorea leprosula TaxID=152421 RepID=A0AAV5MDX8_9ROSI|nr:hypothetical protein SLEP1_g54936 [Rubroshorea leprosula]
MHVRVRREYKANKISEEDYIKAIKVEIKKVVELQEELDIDVLVHGEPERNDMVEYSASAAAQAFLHFNFKYMSILRIGTRPTTPMAAKEVIDQPTALATSSTRLWQIDSNGNLESLNEMTSNRLNVPTALLATSSPKLWFFDSGCHNHMTSSRDDFSSTSSTNPNLPPIQCADGSLMKVTDIGNISAPSLTLSNVYIVPELHYNLLSVSQLCQLGLKVSFSTDGCHVEKSTGEVLGTGCMVNRMFVLNYLHISNEIEETRKYAEVKPAPKNMVAAAKLLHTELASAK